MGVVGVSASGANRAVVREFFELFKIPWEFARKGSGYQVGIVADGEEPSLEAELLLVYGSGENPGDKEWGVMREASSVPAILENGGRKLAAYRGHAALEAPGGHPAGLRGGANGGDAAIEFTHNDRTVIRIGYDLFGEVRHLLTDGQPVENAELPSLDHHIAYLRDVMIDRGVQFLEVGPVPHGFTFTVCLTHDVDHPRLGRHRWDHTAAGFFLRATLGAAVRVVRGRLSLAGMFRNWCSALSLPLVYLGWVKDPWNTFGQYMHLEEGLGSTFFVIPFAGRPGLDDSGRESAKRASAYGAGDIRPDLETLTEGGHEVCLHGIDAWRDAALGRKEQGEIACHQSGSEVGVRMHWLYFGAGTYATLEEAGFTYDSTFGFNETPGFRAGTYQVFKPLEVERLLELPLHIMDTSLFYPSHLGLSEREARRRIRALGRQARELGGVVTVNWHDRSLAPERLWGGVYESMIAEWRAEKAWFPTMGDAATWFRKRRAVRFEVTPGKGAKDELVSIRLEAGDGDRSPPLACRRYNLGSEDGAGPGRWTDQRLDQSHTVALGNAPTTSN